MSIRADVESSRRRASSTVCWRIASVSRSAEMLAAISRTDRSAAARREISSREGARVWRGVGAAGDLLAGAAELVDEPGVLDRDDDLVGECRHQRGVLVVEGI